MEAPDTGCCLAQDGGEFGAGRWKKTVWSMPMVGVRGEVPSRRIAGIVVSENQRLRRRGIVVRILESSWIRSELEEFFDVEAGPI